MRPEVSRLRTVPDRALVLGSGHFEDDVPLKSRFSNVFTRHVFAAAGVKIYDTQTGLGVQRVAHPRTPRNRRRALRV